jgi:hypothetical protein
MARLPGWAGDLPDRGRRLAPSGTRMYCTSQRSYPPSHITPGPGAVYEISGPFRLPATGVPASPFGLPAGERRDGPLRRAGADLRVKTVRRIARRSLLRRGLTIQVTAPPQARVSAVLDTADLLRTSRASGTPVRPRTVKLARRRWRGSSEPQRRRMRLGRTARGRLRRRRAPLTARLLVVAVMPNGRRLSAVRHVRLSRRS